jgi:hypothetical protein
MKLPRAILVRLGVAGKPALTTAVLSTHSHCAQTNRGAMKTQTQSTRYPRKPFRNRPFALAFVAIALFLTVLSPLSHSQPVLIFWLDADDPDTLFQDQAQTTEVVANDDPVGAWVDKSSNGWDVSCPGQWDPNPFAGWKPKFKTNRLNGKPSVRFESNYPSFDWDFLETRAASLQDTSYTFFVLCRRFSLFPQQVEGLLSIFSSDQYGQGGDSKVPGGARIGSSVSYPDAPLGISDARDDYEHLSEFVHPGNDATMLWCSRYDGTANTAYLNGAAGPSIRFTTSFTSEVIQLGANNDGGGLYPPADYEFFEVLIYNGALNDAERAAVENYLNAKWAIQPVITVSASPSSVGEAGGSIQITVSRTGTSGNLDVYLGFTGTATFGADYNITGMSGNGFVTIPAGQSQASVTLIPIQDLRAEGTETVIATVLGAYTTPITITDDDQNAMPANGWQLIWVEPQYVMASYGMGINTVSDGGTGWRGQVAGASSGYYGNSQTNFAFSWNNGVTVLRRWPAAYDGYWTTKWSAGNSLNAIGTIVGHVGHYGYGGWNGYWQRPAFWRVNDTYATELSVITDSQYPLNNSAVDINQRDDPGANAGVIVGQCATLNGKVHAVAWIPDVNGNYGAPMDLQDIGNGNQNSYAGAINNNGVVVGKSQIIDPNTGLPLNNYHAFRSRSQNLQPVQLAGQDDMGTATRNYAHASEGNDINDLGEMVGASDKWVSAGQNQYRAVYKAPGSGKHAGYFDLGVLGSGGDAGNSSVAYAISANGLIVGKSKLKVNGIMVDRAFVISNQGDPGSQPMLNLAEQSWVWQGVLGWKRADTAGWVFTSAERVNRVGWIVGYGTVSGQTHAFVLAPRP